ncbi:hypothetical protein HQ865_24730 [Mucilaginibacter mali]|uniref:Helix-turn-helix domain-containing protein n=1 Tax=Mucilaginibacter mali TaxID=2740462 RepID=A0A7D4QFX6_9SPHI|nr:hypothetical protein [Mucilaginibacter mali]QKJ32824.1 hypothetical protein HQ865_24730 [Mucilaginibacter mali]
MAAIPSLRKAFKKLAADQRITTWHTALCLSLYYLWTEHGTGKQVQVSRSSLMKLTHIRSIVTYHKCIAQLQEYGYIHYQPSYHPKQGSRVTLLF